LKTVTFDVRAKGSGAVGTAPEHGALHRACARSEVIVPVTSVTYQPVSDEATQEACTIYYNHEGLLHKLLGCVGTYTRNIETNGVIVYSYTMTGHSAAPTDVAFAAPGFDTAVPLVAKGAAFTVGGYAATINALSFDAGNTIAMPKDMNSADGYGALGITQFGPKGSFDPLMVTGAVNDFYDDFVNGAGLALDTGVIGSVPGNRLQIQMPAVYYTDISPGDRDGYRTYELPYAAKDVTGDDFEKEIWT
ncbi:MAG: phage tail tube protein, partial [Gammaproteobacteria bacterium]|nr:phage tail tube protein [Gammaproteobacteria bacterium]